MKDNEKWAYQLNLLLDLGRDVYVNSINSYECLEKYDGDNQYFIAANYLGMAHNAYLSLLIFIEKNALEGSEVNEFISAFNEYKIQLDEVIVKKDKNTSWLYSANNNLIKSYKRFNDVISSFVKESMKNV